VGSEGGKGPKWLAVTSSLERIRVFGETIGKGGGERGGKKREVGAKGERRGAQWRGGNVVVISAFARAVLGRLKE